MKSTTKLMHVLALAMLISPAILIQGCGNDPTAVDGATITIDPSTTTASIIDNTTYNYTVIARYKDATPYPKAKLYITGSFAEPRNLTNTTARYQFYFYPGGELTLSNLKVDSGFYAQTDDFGSYRFSVTVYSTVSGSVNSFKDTMHISSGSAFASADLAIN